MTFYPGCMDTKYTTTQMASLTRYVQNGTPKMPHRGYLLHYYILGSVKLLQSWLTSYKGIGISKGVLIILNKQDKKTRQNGREAERSLSREQDAQCSDVTIT